MTATAKKTTKTTAPKMLKLTSPAKMRSARKTRKTKAQPERAAEITAELVEAGTNPQAAEVIAEMIAQAPAPTDLDGNPEAPSLAESIGLTEDAQAEPAVTLEREPGRGWFWIVMDGARVGQLFTTTKSGAKLWAATARPFGRDLRTDATSKAAALAAFVAALRQG